MSCLVQPKYERLKSSMITIKKKRENKNNWSWNDMLVTWTKWNLLRIMIIINDNVKEFWKLNLMSLQGWEIFIDY